MCTRQAKPGCNQYDDSFPHPIHDYCPEPCKLERRPHAFVAGIVPYYPPTRLLIGSQVKNGIRILWHATHGQDPPGEVSIPVFLPGKVKPSPRSAPCSMCGRVRTWKLLAFGQAHMAPNCSKVRLQTKYVLSVHVCSCIFKQGMPETHDVTRLHETQAHV